MPANSQRGDPCLYCLIKLRNLRLRRQATDKGSPQRPWRFCKVALLSGDAALPVETSLFEVAFVISFALAVQIVMSTLIGAMIPLGASRANINPAVMTSPMLTSIVDIGGMLIYFGLATSMLNI